MDIENKNNTDVNINLVRQLMSNPNNEVVWRVFPEEDEDSIFKSGLSAEWFGEGEGGYHGTGVYCFYEPYGAQKRWGGARIGNKIMKCVVLGGFKNFLILDAPVALKYYNSDDIRTQLNILYDDEKLRNAILHKYVEVNRGSTKLHYKSSTSFLSKALFEKFNNKLRSGLTRGVVYNGGNDPHAALLYDSRSIIPIAVTNERYLNKSGNDFDGWKIKLTNNLFNVITTEKDFFSYGEKLTAEGKIRSYSKIPPQHDCLFVVLSNGKYSAYNIALNKFISTYGFDRCMGWEDKVIKKNNGEMTYSMLPVVADNKMFLLRYSPKDEKYYFFRESKKFKPYMTLKKYDSLYNKENLNESAEGGNYLLVYHRTNKISANGIFDKGFSKEYTGTNANIAGPGIYFTFSPEESTKLTSGFGPIMLECRLEGGIKDYLIPQGCVVKGVKCNKPLIEQLIDLTYPKYRDEMYRKYENEYRTDDLYRHLCTSGDLGKTKVRGIIYYYYVGIAGVAADWGSIIAYKYSTNDGRTWYNGTDENKINFIKNHGDAKFALNKFIADGVIEDTFGKSQNSIAANQQFNEGFLRVILRKNKKVSFYSTKTGDLISYVGFDKAVSPETRVEDGVNVVVIPVIINGEKYEIREFGGQYVLYKEINSYESLKLDDGTPISTEIYDKIMNMKK